jgi:transglutaminase-like putative cysteine protease
MRIRISHQTAYSFDPPARAITQILRLEPRGTSCQQIRSWRIETGGDAFLRRGEDSFGNVVHTLHADGPLETFSVTASGEVHTEDTNGVVSGTYEPLPLALFLRETPLTRCSPEIEVFAAEHIGDREPIEGLHRLMDGLAQQLSYDKSTTTSNTTATDAFAAGNGVCQDFSHIFAACARSKGIPTRYVSGYLHEDTAGQKQEQSGQQQSQSANASEAKDDEAPEVATHAWNEAHINGLGWVAFDVTHEVCPTDHYVRVAIGLDALDAAPVRGVRQGAGEEKLDIALTITGDRFGS